MGERPTTTAFRRRKLPHWYVVGRPYFVTICLKGALPKQLLGELERQRRLVEQSGDDEASTNLHRLLFRKVESVLDRIDGPVTWLREPDVAKVVWESLTFLEREWAWWIPACVIMPSHVHVLFAGSSEALRSLADTLESFKGYTAHNANRVLGRRGAFWQEESFDHWCRTSDEEQSTIEYIRENPFSAGLVGHWQDWPWVK